VSEVKCVSERLSECKCVSVFILVSVNVIRGEG
jgi:hypothetical protein